jgi:arylsulfatase A-like enzyme
MGVQNRLRLLCRVLALVSVPLLGAAGAVAQDNVLVIVLDDVGVDMLGTYCKPPLNCQSIDFPLTPNIDALKTSGVLFRNTWSNPTCSPTRATVMTGRYGFRTGVRDVTTPVGSDPFSLGFPRYELPRCEQTIPKVLPLGPLATASAAFGKWHLGNGRNGGALAPNEAGFPHYSGAFANLDTVANYFNWIKTINGRVAHGSNTYATTDNVNDAKAWIQQQTEPWFLWLAFNAPHDPYQAPPANLQSPARPLTPQQICESGNTTPKRQCYLSMIEAADKEIGRLMDEMDPQVLAQTTIILMGDNGTPGDLCDSVAHPGCTNRSKETVYQGGINVPLIIAGAQVEDPDRESAALVNTTDLFATVIELMTGGSAAFMLPGVVLDSKTLVGVLDGTQPLGTRQYAFSESLTDRAIRNSSYKLIRFPAKEEFYDLNLPEIAANNLLDGRTLSAPETSNLNELRTQLDAILASPLGDCDGDGVPQETDKCKEVYNPSSQADDDGDQKGNVCDDCPSTWNASRNFPMAHVNSPNGGQTLTIGSTVNLTWSATDDCSGASIANVDLLVSRTGPDGPFTMIAQGIPNTGTYAWTVAGPATGNLFTAFLKVLAHNTVGNTGLDVSDAGFKIKPNLTASYCSEEGVRCTATSCGLPNCCNTSCGPDPSCAAAEECPYSICGGCL